MRHVFTNREVPHLWAHRTQSQGRTSNGSLYFRNDVIYSYGSHFPIASHCAGTNNQQGILFTSRDYSPTTSQHKSLVRRSIPRDVPVFVVPHLSFGFSRAEDDHQHAENLKWYVHEVAGHLSTCVRARSSYNKEHHHAEAVRIGAEAFSYATFFGLPDPPIDLIPSLDSEALEKLRKREAKASAERATKARKEAEERRQHALSLADSWRNGGVHHYLLNAIPTILRIKGHEVETSQGAKFPIIHAKRGLKLVRAVMARGDEWVSNGQSCRLGHYHINRISADGTVYAGCHVVTWSEIERVAEEIEDYEPRTMCARCQLLSINGVPCHETGCPNDGKSWSIEENGWVDSELDTE